MFSEMDKVVGSLARHCAQVSFSEEAAWVPVVWFTALQFCLFVSLSLSVSRSLSPLRLSLFGPFSLLVCARKTTECRSKYAFVGPRLLTSEKRLVSSGANLSAWVGCTIPLPRSSPTTPNLERFPQGPSPPSRALNVAVTRLTTVAEQLPLAPSPPGILLSAAGDRRRVSPPPPPPPKHERLPPQCCVPPPTPPLQSRIVNVWTIPLRASKQR